MPDLYPNRAARRAAQRNARRRKLVGAVSVLGVGAASGIMVAPPAGAASYDVTNLSTSGPGSLAQAILDANGNAGPDTIVFASGLSGTLTTPQLTITDAVTITGPGGTAVTLDGGGANRILDITSAATSVSISGLRFSHGAAAANNINTDGGGAIRSAADLTLTGIVFADNEAVQNGGAVSVQQADLSISASTFTGNSITGTPLEGGQSGGAVQLIGGNLTVAGSTFTGNDARTQGGALSAVQTTGLSTIVESTFTDNLVTVPGGGVANNAAGGGAYLSGGDFTISGSTFTGNTTSGSTGGGGGGLSVSARAFDDQNVATYGDVKILDSTFSGNSASSGGGAVITSGTLEVGESTFEQNSITAVSSGGGLRITGHFDGSDNLAVVSDSTFSGNTTEEGSQGNGAGINAYSVDLEITGSRFTGNTSVHSGGAVYANGESTLTIDTSTFEGNTATQDGGAISAYVLELAITNTTISGNTATGRGGGVYLAVYADPEAPAAPSATFQNVTLDGNQGTDGAAIYSYLYAYDPASPQLAFSLDHVTITGSPAANSPINLVPAGELPGVFDVTISNTAIDAPLASLAIPDDAAITFSGIGVDPMLGALADNGGPTKTRLPQTGSPLIDAGDPNYATAPGAATTDQRGLPRISGGRTDIGAVEVQAQAGVPVVTVTTPPSNQSVTAGQSATFTAACSATESATVSYQWQVSTNGGGAFADVPGATSAMYTIASTTVSQNGGQYRVVCSAPGATSVTSGAATLTVTAPVPVITVTTNPSPKSVTAGQSASFTAACSATEGATVSYQWQVSTNSGGTFADVPGATSATYTINSTTVSQNGGQYRVVCSAPGATSVTSGAATLTVTAPVPVITVTTNPSPKSVTAGQSATFTAACSATEGAAVSYQWQLSTGGGTFANIPGATSATYTIASTTVAQSGNQYRVVCSAPGATSVTSGAATLTVTAPATAYTVTILSPTSGATVQAGALVPVQFSLTGPNGQKITPLQGLVLTLTCGARVSIAGQPVSCGIYNPLTGNFVTLVRAPTTLTNGATAPLTVTIINGSSTIATATTTVTVRR